MHAQAKEWKLLLHMYRCLQSWAAVGKQIKQQQFPYPLELDSSSWSNGSVVLYRPLELHT